MKTLTVKQPFAHLICIGIKDIENRTWKTNHRGTILIHAGLKPDKKPLDIGRELTYVQKEIIIAQAEMYKTYLFGAIMGQVDIVDCVQNHPSEWAEPNHWHWVLENPILFDVPIRNVKGHLSLWDYPLK